MLFFSQFGRRLTHDPQRTLTETIVCRLSLSKPSMFSVVFMFLELGFMKSKTNIDFGTFYGDFVKIPENFVVNNHCCAWRIRIRPNGTRCDIIRKRKTMQRRCSSNRSDRQLWREKIIFSYFSTVRFYRWTRLNNRQNVGNCRS